MVGPISMHFSLIVMQRLHWISRWDPAGAEGKWHVDRYFYDYIYFFYQYKFGGINQVLGKNININWIVRFLWIEYYFVFVLC